MKYSEMSDFEINKLIALKLNSNVSYSNEANSFAVCRRDGSVLMHCQNGNTELNYCNNASDAWPIMMESNISINLDATGSDTPCAMIVEDGSQYLEWDFNLQCFHENPLRAAMIVYLMINEDK